MTERLARCALVSEHIFGLVRLMDYRLGYFDQKTCRLEQIDNSSDQRGPLESGM